MIALGVVWAGYLLTWYGYSMVRGPGMGFVDLLTLSRVAKANGVVKGWGGKQPSFDQPQGGSFVNSVGVQPGSIYYPPNPKGGLPSKPPLGKTPPAGY